MSAKDPQIVPYGKKLKFLHLARHRLAFEVSNGDEQLDVNDSDQRRRNSCQLIQQVLARNRHFESEVKHK